MQNMNYLEGLVSGKAKQVLTGLSYDGNQYEHAKKLLSRQYFQPDIIVDTQLKLLQKFTFLRIHDYHQKSKFAPMVGKLVSILTNFEYEVDLKSISNINLILSNF